MIVHRILRLSAVMGLAAVVAGCAIEEYRAGATAPYTVLEQGDLVTTYSHPWNGDGASIVSQVLSLMGGQSFGDTYSQCALPRSILERNHLAEGSKFQHCKTDRKTERSVDVVAWVPTSMVGSYAEALNLTRSEFLRAFESAGDAADYLPIAYAESSRNLPLRSPHPYADRFVGFNLVLNSGPGNHPWPRIDLSPSTDSVAVLRGYAPEALGGYPAYVVLINVDWNLSHEQSKENGGAGDAGSLGRLATHFKPWMAVAFKSNQLTRYENGRQRVILAPAAIINGELHTAPDGFTPAR